MKIRTLAVLATGLALSCGPPPDPIPQISALRCSLMPYGEGYQGSFSLDYEDGDRDLDGDGARVEWSLDGIDQAPLCLDSADPECGASPLDYSGTLTLTLSTFPRYELLEAYFQVIDGSGHRSNELYAELNTDPEYETCEPVPP